MATNVENDLLDRLRSGDETAFVHLVERYHGQLIRLASAFVANGDVAEEVAQETWLALLTGIDRFEARSSLRTWLFQICLNRARSIGEREHRTVPVALIEPAVDAEQLTPSGAWISSSRRSDSAAKASSDAELVAVIRMSIGDLPAMQRSVVTMRDVDGLTGKQVCQALSISEANQRVLLHRGRSRIRHNLAAILPAQRSARRHQRP